jgi:predicted dehydrogenase
MNKSLSRRKFIKASAAIASGVAVPYVIPGGVLAEPGRLGANDRINVGFIGVGGRGRGHLNNHKENAAAVCDVDKNHLAAAVKVAGEKAFATGDYRRILERKDIDAVLFATPDHWHATQTVHACQAGKDVYCEKPACNTIAEGRAMVAATRRYNRVVQIGSQGRSIPDSYLTCEYVRNGMLGKVNKVTCWHYENPVDNNTPDSTPPPGLDYEMWLGPAAWRPYNKARGHFGFRYVLDLGGGNIRDRGAHVFSNVLWFMDSDTIGPVSVEATGSAPPKGVYDCPTKMNVTYEFKNPDWTLVWAQPGEKPPEYKGNNFGFKFWGDKDTIYFDGGDGGCIADPKVKRWRVPAGGQTVFHSPGHVQDWLQCIRTRRDPLMNIEAAHKVASLCVIGNISYILGRKLNWDAQKEVVIGDEAANRLLYREGRGIWKI